LQETLDTTTGSPIHGVMQGHLAFLEARSAIALMIPRRLISALALALAEAPAVRCLGRGKSARPPWRSNWLVRGRRVYRDLESSGNKKQGAQLPVLLKTAYHMEQV
jgi:hypothetical protein